MRVPAPAYTVGIFLGGRERDNGAEHCERYLSMEELPVSQEIRVDDLPGERTLQVNATLVVTTVCG